MTEQDIHAFCTTRQAAKLLGVSIRTAQQWVEKGILRAWKTKGGHRRITLESVKKLRASRIANEAELVAAVAQPLPEDRLKVLVVEDDSVLLRLYRLRLESWELPVTVLTAPNAIEGLMLVGREAPDLLITDLAMPGLDGLTMVRTLLQSPFREGMQIVVVTGLSREEIVDQGGLPKGVPVLSKPIPFAELRSFCEGLLKQRQALNLAMEAAAPERD